MPPNQALRALEDSLVVVLNNEEDRRLRCAVLGCGMMGQEHCSYMMGYPNALRINFLCDLHQASLDKCLAVMKTFQQQTEEQQDFQPPTLLDSEDQLLKHAEEIDLLVIATPNYMHTDTILKWSQHDITILLEKPVAVSQFQLDQLQKADLRARIWVAMEYRFIPAISKLIELLDTIGDIKMVTIRENRYQFLHKVGEWNRDRSKTGDTLVEKCCHFFDLMRLITGQEATLSRVRALAQRGINHQDEPVEYEVPIIDAAYVTMPFHPRDSRKEQAIQTMGCLELCMFSEGSRHQEEIIVTGTKGRLEAYLPENKVYAFERPSHDQWSDRSVPPPAKSIKSTVYDCSDVAAIHGIDSTMPTHGGYHYSSTAVEWYKLLDAIQSYKISGEWQPLVSLDDGLHAVEIGLQATRAIVNEQHK